MRLHVDHYFQLLVVYALCMFACVFAYCISFTCPKDITEYKYIIPIEQIPFSNLIQNINMNSKCTNLFLKDIFQKALPWDYMWTSELRSHRIKQKISWVDFPTQLHLINHKNRLELSQKVSALDSLCMGNRKTVVCMYCISVLFLELSLNIAHTDSILRTR